MARKQPVNLDDAFNAELARAFLSRNDDDKNAQREDSLSHTQANDTMQDKES